MGSRKVPAMTPAGVMDKSGANENGIETSMKQGREIRPSKRDIPSRQKPKSKSLRQLGSRDHPPRVEIRSPASPLAALGKSNVIGAGRGPSTKP